MTVVTAACKVGSKSSVQDTKTYSTTLSVNPEDKIEISEEPAFKRVWARAVAASVKII